MRILFVSYSYWPPDFGGELLLSIERFETLVQRGHRVIVLTSGRPEYENRELHNGIEILRSPVVHTSRVGRALRRLLFVFWATFQSYRLDVDVVHYGTLPGIGEFTSALIGLWFNTLFRIKRVKSVIVHSLASTEDESFQFDGIPGSLNLRFLHSVDTLVTISPRMKADAARYFSSASTLLLPNGIRDDVFVPIEASARSRIRTELGLPEQGVIFTFLGSIGARKGFDILAEAFAPLSAKYPNWHLLVIGPRNRLESQNINEAEVTLVSTAVRDNPNVKFYGRVNERSDLAQLLASSDVFVFPSRREGMPLAPMEAMAAGVPPIIARIPGVTDQACVHEESGLYVSVGSVEELKQAMVRLGTDPELRQRYGAAARRRIVEAFSWEGYIDRWENLYTSLVNIEK